MKKTMIYLLSALLLLGALSGCGSAPAKNTQTAAQTAQTYSPEGSVLFDRDGIKVTTAGLDTDPTSEENEPIIWLDIENAGGEDAYLGLANGSVNGIMCDLYLIDFYMEDGAYYGGDYEFQLAVPAGGGRYALGCRDPNVPGADMDTVGEIELCFTLAADEYTWPDYTSGPVSIVTGQTAPAMDIAALGTVAIDNDTMKLVLGRQDYDEFSGPYVYVYIENKTDHFLGVTADAAVADGSECDEFGIFYSSALAPGKCCADIMMFDSPICELEGFESLTVSFVLSEGADRDSISSDNGVALDPVTVSYP